MGSRPEDLVVAGAPLVEGVEQQVEEVVGDRRVARRAVDRVVGVRRPGGDLLQADGVRVGRHDLVGDGPHPLLGPGRLDGGPRLRRRSDDGGVVAAGEGHQDRGEVGAEVEVAGHHGGRACRGAVSAAVSAAVPAAVPAAVATAVATAVPARGTGLDARAGHQCGAQRECRGEEAEEDAMAGGSGHLRTVALPVVAGKPPFGGIAVSPRGTPRGPAAGASSPRVPAPPRRRRTGSSGRSPGRAAPRRT